MARLYSSTNIEEDGSVGWSIRCLDVGYDLRLADQKIRLPRGERLTIDYDIAEDEVYRNKTASGTRSAVIEELTRAGYCIVENIME